MVRGVVVWQSPFLDANSLNSLLTNGAPLSVTILRVIHVLQKYFVDVE